MRTHSRLFRLTAATAIAALTMPATFAPVFAQPAPPPNVVSPGTPSQTTADPPARVGRIDRLSGTVSFHGPSDTTWSAATANYPFAAGYALWTEASARASLEVSASRISLAGGTEFDLTALTDAGLQASIPTGEIYMRVRDLGPNESWTIQTPRGAVTVNGAGRYAMTAGTTGQPTVVTVLEGSAQVSGPGVDLGIAANQTATITGTDTFSAQVGPAQRDAFVTAMLARERPPAQAVLPPVVAGMTGGQDLYDYGTWTQAPEYGQVWYPQVAAGWVPYRDGHWAYVAPWGWTWIDNAPWGFAPFHYGRWVQLGGRWGWAPGEYEASGYAHPAYAPALVTFFGVGTGVAVGVGLGAALAAGSIGWLPLGPREEYHPWYHASDRYIHQVNNYRGMQVNQNVTVNNFSNRGAATMAPEGALRESRPIGQLGRPVPGAALASARPFVGRDPVRPTAATAGVTPAVARELHVAPVAGFTPRTAPGPAIRAAEGRPALENPAGPAAAGPARGLPMLEAPGAREGGRPGQPVVARPGEFRRPGEAARPGEAGRIAEPQVAHPVVPQVYRPGDVARPEAPRAEGPRAEAPRAEAPHPQAPRADAPRADAPRAEASRAEAPRAEAPRPQAPRAEAPRVEVPRPAAPRPAPAARPAPRPEFHAAAPRPAPRPEAPRPEAHAAPPRPVVHAEARPAPRPAPRLEEHHAR
jgi:hypothetical protein